MKKSKATLLFGLFVALVISAPAQVKTPLELNQTVPLPELHDGDFDHFVVDLAGDRLFSTAEEVDRVLALGARRVNIGQGDPSWVVLADPEENEFCILNSMAADAES